MPVSGRIPAPLFDPQRLTAAMEAAGLDAIVAHSQRSFYYLSGFRSLDYVIEPEAANYVVVPRAADCPATVTIPASERLAPEDEPIWVPNKIYCGNFFIHQAPALQGATAGSTFEGLLLALQESGLTSARVGFELELLPVTTYQRLAAACPGMQIADASPLLHQLRMVKTPEEVQRIRRAAEITEQAMDECVSRARPGMTDCELTDVIAAGIVSSGAEVVYVQVALPGAAGLGLAVGRTLNKGDIVRLDVAAVYQGYNSDLGRGFVLGSPTAEQKQTYRAAYQALQAGIGAVRAGRQAREIFADAMAAWAGMGYSHVRRHHVGHGIGLQAHEAPLLKPSVEEVIRPGMVLAIEVPYYVYGVGGFAPEDNLLVGEDDITLFTHVPSELPVA